MGSEMCIRDSTVMATREKSSDLTPLLVWLSPAFPVGSYAYSHGLEWAVEAGDVHDAESCAAWIADLIQHGGPWSDAVLLAQAHFAVTARHDAKLAEIVELAAALAPSRERKMETLNQGAAFLLAVRAAWPSPGLDWTHACEGPVAFPVAVGFAAAAHGIGPVPTLEAYLVALATNLVSAAVRLIPLGQTDGTRIVAGIVPLARKIAALASSATLDDIGGAALRSDIASMRHETQHTRLFRS